MVEHHSFATAALTFFQDKIVEINTAEIHTTLRYVDSDSNQKSLIRGKLIDAVGDALVIETQFGSEKQVILINCWAITAMTEIKNGRSLSNFYLDEFQSNYKR